MTRSGPLRDNANFRRYWIGRAVSDLGSQLSLVAYPLLVLAMGGTAAQAGGVATASLLAQTICRLPAGLVADRYDRYRVMVTADLVRAVALASIPFAALLGDPVYPHVLLVAVIEGAATSLFRPAAIVAIRQLVPPDQLTVAMARNQSRTAAVSLAGPALGGWLFTVHRLVPFVADAFSYLVSAMMIRRITASPSRDNSSRGSDWRLLVGLRWLAHHRMLRNVYAFAGVINLIATSAVLVVVVTARAHGQSGTVIGLLLACIGVGAVLGAAITPAILRVIPVPAMFIILGAGWVGTLAVLLVTPSPWAVGSVLAAQFLLSPAAGVLVGKAMLLEAPDEIRGRVTTAADLLMSGLPAAGPLLTGFLLDAGISEAVIALAALAAIATLVSLPTFLTPGFLTTPDRQSDRIRSGGFR